MDYKKILKISFAVALLAVLLYIANFQRLVGILKTVKPDLYFAGVLLFLATYIPMTLRWKNLSESIGYDIGVVTSLKVMTVSLSFNKLFPGNSGDVLRSKISQRYHSIDNHGNIIGIVGLERFLDVLGLGTVISFATLFVASSYFKEMTWLLIPFMVMALIASVFLFVHEKYLEKIFSILPFGEKFLSDVMAGYRSCSRKSLLLNLGYALSIWVLEAASFYLFIQALGLPLSFWDGALVTSLMSLVSGLPITPAGLGAVDATGTGLLVIAGISTASALSLVVLQRSVGLILMGLIGMLVYGIEELSK